MRQVLYKHVRNQLRRFFYFCHLLLKELFCLGGNFLVTHKVIVGVVLALDGSTVENLGELRDEQVNRSTIADQMMRVSQQRQLVGLNNLKPHAGAFL